MPYFPSEFWIFPRISRCVQYSSDVKILIVFCACLHCLKLNDRRKSCCVPLYLADSDDEDREDEDSQGHPGHVGFEAPGLGKVAPALVDTRSHFWTGEDENLEEQTAVCKCPPSLRGRKLYNISLMRENTS